MKLTYKNMLYKYVNGYKPLKDKYTIDEYLENYYFEIVMGYHLDYDKFKRDFIRLLKKESD